MLDCRDIESVFKAVERRWRELRTGDLRADIYEHLAVVLNEDGYLADNEDGLSILAHCRRAGLPIADVQEELETRVRRAGYVGGPLTVADSTGTHAPLYVFYDSRRFDRFAEVRNQLGLS